MQLCSESSLTVSDLVPNGFSACCSLCAYGPARVQQNAGLSVLLWEIIVISH